ncbi:hypothetical protein J31TS3_04910 [Paenibacillus lactis]|nr:hypothetical protein J31TS3_04910 [Paenibacillus lactis]
MQPGREVAIHYIGAGTFTANKRCARSEHGPGTRALPPTNSDCGGRRSYPAERAELD